MTYIKTQLQQIMLPNKKQIVFLLASNILFHSQYALNPKSFISMKSSIHTTFIASRNII